MQPKRFDCKNIKDGARGTMVGKVQPTLEADAWGRAPRVMGWSPPRGLPLLRERQAREADQRDLAEKFMIRQ
jgi:hypothetical protein